METVTSEMLQSTVTIEYVKIHEVDRLYDERFAAIFLEFARVEFLVLVRHCFL